MITTNVDANIPSLPTLYLNS